MPYMQVLYLMWGMILNGVLLEMALQNTTTLTYKIVIVFLFIIISSNIFARVTLLIFFPPKP